MAKKSNIDQEWNVISWRCASIDQRAFVPCPHTSQKLDLREEKLELSEVQDLCPDPGILLLRRILLQSFTERPRGLERHAVFAMHPYMRLRYIFCTILFTYIWNPWVKNGLGRENSRGVSIRMRRMSGRRPGMKN